MQQWGADRIEDLASLVAAAAPGEELSPDELLTACYEQPGVVLGAPGGAAAVALGLRRDPAGDLVAVVRLVAVHPDQRRSGVGRQLLAVAESWALDRGAQRLEMGGSAPFSLWSGVAPDSELAALAVACGYTPGNEVRGWTVPVSFRAAPPDGVVVRRAVRDGDVTAVTLAAAATWPRASDEVARALDHGTCHVALTSVGADDGAEAVVGIGCHSVTRAGWVGPLVVVPGSRRRGVGSALLGQVCRDLMIAELPAAHVPGVDQPEVEAFLAAAGAQPGPARRPLHRPLPA